MATTAPRVAASVRLILAMFRLYANLEAGFGKAVLDILKAQYPEQAGEIDLTPNQVGRQLIQKAKKEVQGDEQAAYDTVQDFLVKITNAKTDFRSDKMNEDGTVKSKGAKDWRSALNNILNNIRRQGMNISQRKYRDNTSDEDKYAGLLYTKQRSTEGKPGAPKWDANKERDLQVLEKKLRADKIDPSTIQPKRPSRDGARTKTLDEAFGKRDGEGGDPTGGEGNIPTSALPSGGGSYGKPLDEKAALKSFYEAIDDNLPELKRSLSKDTLPLFELIFDHDIGDFRNSLKDGDEGTGLTSMNQATQLMTMLTAGKVDMERLNVKDPVTGKITSKPLDPDSGRSVPGYPTSESKALYERNSHRWSSKVGELRKELLQEIQDFVESYMAPAEIDVLWDAFFKDSDQVKNVNRTERRIEEVKKKEQSGKEDRTIARIKWELENGDSKNAKKLEMLKKKYGQAKLDQIVPRLNPGASSDEDKYAHMRKLIEDAVASLDKMKAEKASNDAAHSKGAIERAGQAAFQLKKKLEPELKPLTEKLIEQYGQAAIDAVPADANPEGSANRRPKASVSSLLAIAARVAAG